MFSFTSYLPLTDACLFRICVIVTTQESDISHAKIKAELEKRITDAATQAKSEAEESINSKKQLADMLTAKAELDWQAQKHHEEIDRLTKLMDATSLSREQTESAIVELTTQSKSDRQEMEKLQRQLMENELMLRTKQGELTHLKQQSATELTVRAAAKLTSDEEIGKWQEKYQKAMDNVASLQRDGLEHESLARKQSDEIERLQTMLQDAAAAKAASDTSILEVTGRSPLYYIRLNNHPSHSTYDILLALLTIHHHSTTLQCSAAAKATLTEHQQQNRARHELLDKQIDELTSQVARDKEALESSRRELLERDLLIRQEKSESHRVQLLMDEVGVHIYRLTLS